MPELELTAYLGVFLDADVVEEVLDRVAMAALEADAQDVMELYVLAHLELHELVRVAPAAELDVLTDEGGLTPDEAALVMGPLDPEVLAAAGTSGAVAGAASPPTGVRVLQASAPDLPRQPAADVRVLAVRPAHAAAGRSAVHVDVDAGAGAEVDGESDAGDAGVYPRVSHTPSRPLVPRTLVVVLTIGLVLWLGIALTSDAARDRFALIGLNPWLLLLGVAGPMLAGYAFLRAGDALGDDRTIDGEGSGHEADAAADDLVDDELAEGVVRIIDPGTSGGPAAP